MYPKNSVRRPKLLEQLQDTLAHKMCAAEMAVDANLVPGQRNPDAAACLKLDVYRQVFDAFIDGFAAYRPLLTQVKVRNHSSARRRGTGALHSTYTETAPGKGSNVMCRTLMMLPCSRVCNVPLRTWI